MSFLFYNFVVLMVLVIVFGVVYVFVVFGYMLVYGVLCFINFVYFEIWMWGSFVVVWVLIVVGVFCG